MARRRYETSSERAEEEGHESARAREHESARDFESESDRFDEDFERGIDEVLQDTVSGGISKVAEVVGFVGTAGACEQLAVTCKALAELGPDERDALDEERRKELARLNIRSADLDKE